MRKNLLLLSLPLLSGSFVFCQSSQSPTIHREQSAYYSQFNFNSDAEWDSLGIVNGTHSVKQSGNKSLPCTLQKRVYGWHPYWMGSVYNNYNWSLISDLSYFSYEVDASTGNALTTHNWLTAAAVTAAQQNGVRVNLCATLFSNHAAFLSSASAKQNFISTMISLIQQRNANGCNIDFEGVPLSQSANLVSFMNSLANQMHAAIPGSEVTIALPSVDWSSVYNTAAMTSVDLFIIMGYDYYWSGSTTAGPTDPLYNFQTSYNYTLTKSITWYLNAGVPNNKLLLGVPYYGREWPTSTGTIPSATTANGVSRTYNFVRNNVSGYYSNQQWDPVSYTPYYSFNNGNWNQCFINSDYSMGKRYDVVNQYGIGGIGIWALGYDDGYQELWNKIQDKFSDCGTVACSDTIFDMGGPNRNYYDNEDYTFTIAPSNAYQVSLAFSMFNTELNYDSLWIFDGSSTSSPLIGGYTGTNSPGTIVSSGPTLTLRFKSDGNTLTPGYYAVYSCLNDVIDPTTQINAPLGWITQNFTANFNDADNTGGSGVQKSFYHVIDFDGTEWRANKQNGFFRDNFDLAIHPDWTSYTGAWGINTGVLEQSDENNSNTSLSADLNQNLSNRYCYHFQGRIDGVGSNRRAGLHFFSDDGSLPNRGNSYFVWFRADQSELQFYKVTNDVFSLEASFPMTITAGTWYDYKVTYDRVSGVMEVFQNDIGIGSWTDPSPIFNGSYISLRSGDCNFQVNDFKVYRSRAASVNVSVGSPSSDIRYQSPNPTTQSAKIKSIIYDNAGNWSTTASFDMLVDWTSPSDVLVSDGIITELDTTFNNTQLDAFWTSSLDPNSGIATYWYAMGTTPGGTDVVNWVNYGSGTSVGVGALNLTYNQLYYTTVQVENGAGLLSNAVSSDGILVLLPTGVNESSNLITLHLFPNPITDQSQLVISSISSVVCSLTITDLAGRTIWKKELKLNAGENKISLGDLDLARGMYFLRAGSVSIPFTK
jgi:spore germination protein YaaH